MRAGQVDKSVAFAKETIATMLAAGQRPSEQMFVIPARALQEANRTNEMFDMLALRVQAYPTDRKSVVTGTSVSVRVDLGGSRIIKQKKLQIKNNDVNGP